MFVSAKNPQQQEKYLPAFLWKYRVQGSDSKQFKIKKSPRTHGLPIFLILKFSKMTSAGRLRLKSLNLSMDLVFYRELGLAV